jgi:rare lipoprotein A
MKPIALALCVAAATASAQAQTAGERGSAPARHAATSRQTQAPAPVSALLKWLHDKAAPAPAKAGDKAAPAPAKVAEKPKPAPAKTEVRRQEVKHPEPRQQDARHLAVHRHHAKAADDADAAPPVVTMTVAVAPPAAAVADPPAPVTPPMYHTAAAAPVAPPTNAPTVVPAPTPPAVTRSLAVAPAATADPPRDPAMPRAVATLTVTRQTFAPPERPPGGYHSGGYHSCSSGERIITAFYWEGKHTASGEPFDPDGFTAAHRTYAFGTKLLVFNPRNGKSVTVRVNDRGPFVKGVTLDLSRGAAKAIGMQGTGAVCIAKM